MTEILLLRHGKTAGNLEHRYVGCCTDEPLCEEGRRELTGKKMPPIGRLYVSPMKRCAETAEILWPQHPPLRIIPNLRETDFGDFEYKNYEDLSGNPDYQAWVDSGGALPFPNGETTEFFRKRCCNAFEQIVDDLCESREEEPRVPPNILREDGRAENSVVQTDNAEETALRAGIVAHGGTIMAILERFGFPKMDYFDYQVKNGCGYLLTPVEGTDLWNYRYLP
ncbi:MAG: histidine phosphatase family protein [Lachnospiraceae bacterium]|nr:histidine phosphatase family protein [Lachnospiraceae bacterium]